MQNNFILNVFKKASLCRNFELKVFEQEKKNIKIPVYLSAGQEFISSTLSTICEQKKIKPLLFPQHRCHSIYLSFGGDIKSNRRAIRKKIGMLTVWEGLHQFTKENKNVRP